MDHLHREFDVGPDAVIEVTLDHPANVLLLDTTNYHDYRSGQPYRYHGGYAKASPVHLRPPRPGRWHVVVDLGGYTGAVRAAVQVIDPAVPQEA